MADCIGVDVPDLSVPSETSLNRVTRNTECVAVPFFGGYIPAVVVYDEPHVILKPIVDMLGIAWAPQHTKLSAARWASITLVVTQLPGEEQARQYLAVSLETFVVWLAGIQEGRVKEEAQETVINYKREAGRVLRNHFFGKPIEKLDELEVARRYVAQIEANRAMRVELESARSKVAVFDAWFDPDNAVETTDFAKRLGMRSAQELNRYLRDLGIIRKDLHPRTGKPRNLPTADWTEYFKVVPTRIPTGEFIDVAWILPEGQIAIVEELRNHGIMD